MSLTLKPEHQNKHSRGHVSARPSRTACSAVGEAVLMLSPARLAAFSVNSTRATKGA